MTQLTPHRIGFLTAALTLAADQGVKALLLGRFALARELQVTILPIFNFTYTRNTGVSLGLLHAGSDIGRWLLVALTAAIAAGVAWWMRREARTGELVPLGLVLGGALGNIADRVTRGYVFDYADLHFGSYRPFLVFNLADAAITVGVLIILARSFLIREKRGHVAHAGPPATTAPES